MADDLGTIRAPLSTPRPLLVSPIPLIIPAGGISLLAGAPGIGKTALIATLARDLRDGRPIFGHQPAPVPAIGIVSADRGWAEGAGEWFKRAGYPEIRYYSLTDDPHFNPKRLRKKWDRTDLLMEFIDRLELPWGALVIVDPIALFLGGNLLDYDGCAVACLELRRLLQYRGLTLIATAHSAKLRADKKERYLRLQDQILGSTAIFGFTDTQMYLASPAELGKDYYMFLWHSHVTVPETFCLERDEQGLFVPYTGVDLGTQARVLNLFPPDGTEVTFGALVELAEALPLKRRQLKNVLEQLLADGRIEHVKHGCYRRIVLQ